MDGTDSTANSITMEESPDRSSAMPNLLAVLGSLFLFRRNWNKATSRGVSVTMKNGPMDSKISVLTSLTFWPGAGRSALGCY